MDGWMDGWVEMMGDVSSSHLPSSSAHAFGDTLASIIDDGTRERDRGVVMRQ